MAELDAYLFFDGDCADAMRFYERVLGGKIEAIMTYGESPMAADSGPGMKDRVMHASMLLGERRLMASDGMPGQPTRPSNGFALSVNTADVAEGRRLFDALAEGGSVTMPFDKTFWAEGFGMLTDRFGVPWMVNVSAPQT